MKKIIFSIEKIIDNIIKNNAIYSEIGYELNGFNKEKIHFEQPVWGISNSDAEREETDGTKRRYSDYDRRISKKSRFLLK